MLLFVDVPILSTIIYILRDSEIYAFPFWLVIPAGLFFGVWSIIYIDKAITQTKDDTSIPEGLSKIIRRTPPTSSQKIVISGVLLTVFIVYSLSDPSYYLEYFEFEGVIIGSIKLFIAVFGYGVIILEFVIYILSINILLPIHVYRTEPDIVNPQLDKFGGTKAVGKLIKNTTIIYFTGLILFSFNTVLQSVFAGPYGPSAFEQQLFLIMWAFGIPIFGFPVYMMHRYMKKKKNEFESEVKKKIDPIDDIDKIGNQDSAELTEYNHYILTLERLESMKEYPVDTSMVRDTLFSALLPLLLQTVLTALISGSVEIF